MKMVMHGYYLYPNLNLKLLFIFNLESYEHVFLISKPEIYRLSSIHTWHLYTLKKNQNKEFNQPVLQFKQNKLADLLLELHLLLLELDLLLLLELLLHCWSGPSFASGGSSAGWKREWEWVRGSRGRKVTGKEKCSYISWYEHIFKKSLGYLYFGMDSSRVE